MQAVDQTAVAMDTPAGVKSLSTLETSLDLTYAWQYAETRETVRDLYLKATQRQWIADDMLPWHLENDPELPLGPDDTNPLWGTDVWRRMTPAERRRFNREFNASVLSQLLHGEQGGLLTTAQLVDTLPDLDSKLFGATQVVDEARHVEVVSRYLNEKVGLIYPVSSDLKKLFDLVLTDGRWDIKFLGNQIVVEGVVLALLTMFSTTARDPLLRAMTSYMMLDEARHMAYGVMSLRDHYLTQSESFRREREDLVFEAVTLMRNRLLYREVWERLGLPVKECMDLMLHAPAQVNMLQIFFAKVVPTVKKMGLLSERQRRRFAQLGILQLEHVAEPFSDAVLDDAASRRGADELASRYGQTPAGER